MSTTRTQDALFDLPAVDAAAWHYAPADVRFDIVRLDEPERGATHLVRVIELPGEQWPCETQVDSFVTDDPYGAVEALRESQVFTLEQRFALYAERGW